MSEEECVVGVAKLRRKGRKGSPKPRGRSPANNREEERPPPTTSKNSSLIKKGIPANPPRRGNRSPTVSDERFKKERSARKMSPKRGNSCNGNLNDTKSSSKSATLQKGSGSPRSRSRSRPPKQGVNKDSGARLPSPKHSGARGRSPSSSHKRGPTKNTGDRRCERTEDDSVRNGKRSNSAKRQDGQRPGSPKRSGGKKHKSRNKGDHCDQFSAGAAEPCSELMEETDEDETESECSESPRYVSPKGNTTGLQLDLSKMGGADMPVFSLLDDNSLFDASTDDERSRSNSPKRPRSNGVDSQHRESLLDTVNTGKREQEERASTAGPAAELGFAPWGFEGEDEPQKKKSATLGSASPKGSLSPLGLKRAVKAFKYTPPSMSGASNLMEKLNRGFQQRLGLSEKHQQMKDEDDLASLL